MSQPPESLAESITNSIEPGRVVRSLRVAVYSLTALLGLSLLSIGTIAVIAQLKGTWHWMIHLESSVSFMSLFVAAIVAVLVPLFGAFVVARRWFDA